MPFGYKHSLRIMACPSDKGMFMHGSAHVHACMCYGASAQAAHQPQRIAAVGHRVGTGALLLSGAGAAAAAAAAAAAPEVVHRRQGHCVRGRRGLLRHPYMTDRGTHSTFRCAACVGRSMTAREGTCARRTSADIRSRPVSQSPTQKAICAAAHAEREKASKLAHSSK